MFREIWKSYLKEYQGRSVFILIAAVTIVGSLLEGINIGLLVPLMETLANPGSNEGHWISRVFADIMSALGIPFRLGPILLILAVVIVATCSLKYLRITLAAKTQERFTSWTRARYMWDVLHADLAYFHRAQLGTLSDAVTAEAIYAGAIVLLIIEMLALVGMTVAYLLAAFLVDPTLTGIAVGSMVIISLSMQYYIRKAKAIGTATVIRQTRLQSAAVETLSGIHVIKSFLLERFRWNEFTGRAEDMFEVSYQREQNIARMTITQELSVFALIGGIVYVGISFLSVDVAVIMVLLFVLYRLAPRVSQLNTIRHGLVSGLASLEQVHRILAAAKASKIISGTKPFTKLTSGIQLDHAYFSYNDNAEVLRDTNFTIEKGKTTAIIGASGAGKSTLIDLLLRFYDPQDGRILVDGVDLREMDLASWRSSIGVVSQETFLFNDTASYNISLGRSNVTQDMVIEAARRAYVHDFICKLPQGYDTQIGDRGWNLSGGERQRLALARAIVSQPQILILDEATSSLDSESEQLIQEYMSDIHETCTLIVVAHRMATIRNSDTILVLQDGRIVEEGDWDTLMKQAGIFAIYKQLQSTS